MTFTAFSDDADAFHWSATIQGVPVAKARPRFARTRNGGVKTYNPQETEEGRLRWEIKRARGRRREPMFGPIVLWLEFGMPIPARASGKARRAMAASELAHTKKPDLDNLIKTIKDVSNGILWVDDSQVVEVHARKYYSERPQTIIGVRHYSPAKAAGDSR